jgi:hypothetical protein
MLPIGGLANYVLNNYACHYFKMGENLIGYVIMVSLIALFFNIEHTKAKKE